MSSDPKTDWSKVNIDGLREHLVDMDELVLRARSTTTVFDSKSYSPCLDRGRTLQAIQAMIPAHGGVLSQTTNWEVKSELTENGAIMSISTDNHAALKVIKALDFSGLWQPALTIRPTILQWQKVITVPIPTISAFHDVFVIQTNMKRSNCDKLYTEATTDGRKKMRSMELVLLSPWYIRRYQFLCRKRA